MANFVPGTEDVPLMKEMTLIEEPMLFDKPEGRVVITTFITPAPWEKITSFYKDILPNFGWAFYKTSTPDKMIFVRQQEQLSIYPQKDNAKGQQITIEIKPL